MLSQLGLAVDEVGNGKLSGSMAGFLTDELTGGRPLSGRYSGLGSMLQSFCGAFEIFMTCMDGGNRLLHALLLGTAVFLVAINTTTDEGRLPASPMWMIALYAKGMQKVDTYLVPPLW